LGSEPGNRYAYSSAGMNLMGGVLTLGTRTWLPELFDRTIARPLDFGTYYWNLMPTEEGYLAGGSYLRPRDLMKIGQVYLDGGVWNGRRIVDSVWVTRSTSPQVEVSPASTGLSKEEFPNYYFESHDGFAWHLYDVRVGQRTYREYESNGNGGQFVIVIPELELVVTFTGGNYGQGGIWGRWRENIVGQVIAPAIRE
jgi:CubicO group peptidase (beta-lactamase class C family)